MDERMLALADEMVEAFREGDGEAVQALVAGQWDSREMFGATLELFNRREFDLLAATRAPGSIHDMRPTDVPGMGVYNGPAGYRRFLDEWMDVFAEAEVELVDAETFQSSDRRLWFVLAEQTMKGGESGIAVEVTYAAVGESRADGLVEWSFFDRDTERARARFGELVAEEAG